MTPQISSINIDASLSNLENLRYFILREQPEILVIQDLPKLKNYQILAILTTISDSRYTIHTLELLNGQSDKLIKINNAILTKDNHTSNTELISGKEGEISTLTLSVTIQLQSKHKLIVSAIYIRPHSTYIELNAALKCLSSVFKQYGRSRQVLIGDVNTETILWAPNNVLYVKTMKNYEHLATSDFMRQFYIERSKRARLLTYFLQQNKLTVMNDDSKGPTYFFNDVVDNHHHHRNNKGTSSYLDIIAMGTKAARMWSEFKVNEKIGPDHCRHRIISLLAKQRKFPTIDNMMIDYTSYSTKTKTIYKWQKMNMKTLENINKVIKTRCRNWQLLERDQIINLLEKNTSTIQQTLLLQQQAIAIKITRPTKTTPTSITAAAQIEIIKNKPQKWLLKLKSMLNNNKDEQRKNDLSIKNKSLILEEMFHEIRDICSKSKSDSLQTKNNNNNIEKLDTIIEEKFPHIDRTQAYKTLESIIQKQQLDNVCLVGDNEIDQAIYEVRNKNYTGADGIKFKTLQKALPILRDSIGIIAKMSFFIGHVPRSLLKTRASIIFKKTTHTDQKQKRKFRLVHITCSLTAILERIALHRIEYRIEQNKLMSSSQFGFVPRVGRSELITRILEVAYKHWIEKPTSAHTVIIGLDIEGAFDNADHTLLIEKINETFDKDLIKIWLIDFILNRNIRILFNNESSKTTDVCKGVPQGSALGPVLWNLAINDLDSRMFDKKALLEEEGEEPHTHILKYADDIILVHNGKNLDTLQNTIDAMTKVLDKDNLSINPDKSTMMAINWPYCDKNKKLNEINIRGQKIPKVSTTNILGIPINKNLSLDINHDMVVSKIASNIKILKLAKHLKIVNNNGLWKILIESYIQSIIIDKFLPILAVDKKGREWADKTMIRTIRSIFDWSENTPAKVIKLILDLNTADNLAIKYLNNKREEEFRNHFTIIQDIFFCKGDLTGILSQSKAQQQQPRSTAKARFLCLDFNLKRPIFANPASAISNTQRSNCSFQDLIRQYHHYYILIEEGTRTTIVERNGRDITISIAHTQHAQSITSSYFNSMSALMQTVYNNNNDKSTTRQTNTTRIKHKQRNTIFMSNKNSLYTALTNPKNHDWRIVKLKNAILRNRWTVKAINQKHYTKIKKKLASETNKASETTITTTSSWPDITDYINKCNHAKLYCKMRKRQTKQCLTDFTRAISAKTEIWHMLQPHRLNSTTLMTLGGMIKTQDGAIVKGILNVGDTFDCCGTIVTEEKSHKYVTLHRIFDEQCSVKDENLESLISTLKNKNRNYSNLNNQQLIEKALKDYRKLRLVSRILNHAAGFHNSTPD